MSTLEAIILIAIAAAGLVLVLTIIGMIIERVRDRLNPQRRQPVVFDRYKTKVYDQDK